MSASSNTEKEDKEFVRAAPRSELRTKHQRRIQYKKELRVKRKLKKKERKQRREEGLLKQVPKTIDNLREADCTTVGNLEDEDNKEVQIDIANSEYAPYFAKTYEPKVLITYSSRTSKKTNYFGRELMRIIPNSLCRLRRGFTVKKIVAACNRHNYTDIVIINEDKNQPNGLMVIHLPDGPTANFRLSNVKISPELRRSYKEISEHRPEVILNNFSTRLGNSIASMLAALFHYDPEFRGRRAVTFHNQRDYIFFRHHRYEFKKNGEKVGLRELGPRFTLKLRWLQSGVFDPQTAEYEWIITGRRHELETSRRKFFL